VAARLETWTVHALNLQQRVEVPVNVDSQVCKVWERGTVKRLVETAVCFLAAVASHQAAAEADCNLLELHVRGVEEGREAGDRVNEVLARIGARHRERQLRSGENDRLPESRLHSVIRGGWPTHVCLVLLVGCNVQTTAPDMTQVGPAACQGTVALQCMTTHPKTPS
jgi:hypothetical protein